MQQPSCSRRGFLGALAAGAAWTVAGRPAVQAEETVAGFRFVHLTDIHVQPELAASQGMARCLEVVAALDPQPDFILTGGDLVMDTLAVSHERARALWDLYRKVQADHASVPVRQCIGNHDVFGWSNRHGATPDHPHYGKKMVQEILELPSTYYHFDHKGWRFVVLDDIQPAASGLYQAYIDETQWDWLEKTLAEKPAAMPAVVVSHIPILTVTIAAARFDQATNDYRIGAALMCRDALKLTDLFARHNVRLALSGHIHECDRVDFRGVTFICDGAVSAGWWKGPHKGVQEGFGIIDVSPDGTFRHAYHDYGWTPIA